ERRRPTPPLRDSRPRRHRAGSRQLAARTPPAAVALAAGILAAACGGSTNTLTVAGTVEIREVRLSPLASGRLQRLLKDEGDSVRVGDTVAVLEQPGLAALIDRKSTRLNSSHDQISYAVFCLKKKKHTEMTLSPSCISRPV